MFTPTLTTAAFEWSSARNPAVLEPAEEQEAAARELVRIARTAAPLDGGADLSDRARHLARSISRHTTAVRARRVLAEGPRDTGGTRQPRDAPTAPGDNVVLKFAPRRVKRIQIDDDVVEMDA